MAHNAELAELAIVFINRYRSSYPDVNSSLNEAEEKFFKGNYRESLEISVNATSLIDENICRKLKDLYEK